VSTKKRRKPPRSERQPSQVARRCVSVAAATFLAGAFTTPASAAPGDDQPRTISASEGVQVARGPMRNAPQAPPQQYRQNNPQQGRPGSGQLDPATGRALRDAEQLQQNIERLDNVRNWKELTQELDKETDEYRELRDMFSRQPTLGVPPTLSREPSLGMPPTLSTEELRAVESALKEREPRGYVNQYFDMRGRGFGEQDIESDRANIRSQMRESQQTEEERAPHLQRLDDAISGIHGATTRAEYEKAVEDYNTEAVRYNDGEHEKRKMGDSTLNVAKPRELQRLDEDRALLGRVQSFEEHINQMLPEPPGWQAAPTSPHWSISPDDLDRANGMLNYGVDGRQLSEWSDPAGPINDYAGTMPDISGLGPDGSIVSAGYPGMTMAATNAAATEQTLDMASVPGSDHNPNGFGANGGENFGTATAENPQGNNPGGVGLAGPGESDVGEVDSGGLSLGDSLSAGGVGAVNPGGVGLAGLGDSDVGGGYGDGGSPDTSASPSVADAGSPDSGPSDSDSGPSDSGDGGDGSAIG
jgi:hypothetical protein